MGRCVRFESETTVRFISYLCVLGGLDGAGGGGSLTPGAWGGGTLLYKVISFVGGRGLLWLPEGDGVEVSAGYPGRATEKLSSGSGAAATGEVLG